MTQEDKELLLKDICGRLSYGVRIKIGRYSGYKIIGIDISDNKSLKLIDTKNRKTHKVKVPPYIIKPYLRPMSSMTEEEKKEYHNLCYAEERECYEFGEWTTRIYFHDTIESIDWLNAHHFDFRNLIEKGLAIAVTEKNNPYETIH